MINNRALYCILLVGLVSLAGCSDASPNTVNEFKEKIEERETRLVCSNNFISDWVPLGWSEKFVYYPENEFLAYSGDDQTIVYRIKPGEVCIIEKRNVEQEEEL